MHISELNVKMFQFVDKYAYILRIGTDVIWGCLLDMMLQSMLYMSLLSHASNAILPSTNPKHSAIYIHNETYQQKVLKHNRSLLI